MIPAKKLTILVASHKPFVLPHCDNLLPIHCGRAVSKLDEISLSWMRAHTIGDDTGDNISYLNPFFCELTAIYWAWKNYEKLNTPEQIGLCHYRRYFMDFGSHNEITVPTHYLGKTVREQFNQRHNPSELKQAVNLLPNTELRSFTEEYLSQKKGYFFNMFILKQDLFFEYCEILFNILFILFQTNEWQKLDNYQKRMPGFIAERLTGGYIYYLNKKKNIPVHESLAVVPICDSWSKLQTQIRLTAFLNRSIPKFSFFYSKFLSLQTHLLH